MNYFYNPYYYTPGPGLCHPCAELCCDDDYRNCSCVNRGHGQKCECQPSPLFNQTFTADTFLVSMNKSGPLWRFAQYFNYSFPNQIAVPAHRYFEWVDGYFENMTVGEIIDQLGLIRLRPELISLSQIKMLRQRHKYRIVNNTNRELRFEWNGNVDGCLIKCPDEKIKPGDYAQQDSDGVGGTGTYKTMGVDIYRIKDGAPDSKLGHIYQEFYNADGLGQKVITYIRAQDMGDKYRVSWGHNGNDEHLININKDEW